MIITNSKYYYVCDTKNDARCVTWAPIEGGKAGHLPLPGKII